MVTKYKDEDIKLHSTTKYIKINAIIYGIIIIIFVFISCFYSEIRPVMCSTLIIFSVVFCIYFQVQYSSLETKEKVLFIQRGFWKHQILYKDIISIYKSSIDDLDNYVTSLYITITYKKENRIKHLKIPYKEKRPFLKIELIKENEIDNLVNMFYDEVSSRINSSESTNLISTEYKDIRTVEETAQLKEFLDKKRKNEQIGMWVFMVILIAIMLGIVVWLAL